MSFAVITMPTGYPAEQKRALLAGMKLACAEGFELDASHCFAWIQEFPAENFGEGLEGVKSCIVYTTYGKSIGGKNTITRRFDEICKEVFGEPDGVNICIFKEHVAENTGARGVIRALKPFLEG